MAVLEKKEYPLGECEIKFTPKDTSSPVVVALTAKDSDCIFSCTTETFKYEVDQLSGPYKTRVLPGETTLKCSIWADLEILSALTNVYEKGKTGYAFSTSGKEMQEGKLEIHPLSEGSKKDFDIMGPKVFVEVDTNFSFKVDGQAKCDLTFEFAADENPESPTYRKLFTIGQYAPNMLSLANLSEIATDQSKNKA